MFVAPSVSAVWNCSGEAARESRFVTHALRPDTTYYAAVQLVTSDGHRSLPSEVESFHTPPGERPRGVHTASTRCPLGPPWSCGRQVVGTVTDIKQAVSALVLGDTRCYYAQLCAANHVLNVFCLLF